MDGWQLLFYMVYIMIRTLLHYKELRACVVPLHVWIAVEWIFMICMPSLFCVERIRLTGFAELAIIPLFALFVLWNILGMVFYVVALLRSPQCFPPQIAQGLGLFFFMALLGIGLLAYLMCSLGIRHFNQYFHTERQDLQQLQDIAEGRRAAADVLRQPGANVDGHTLYPAEIEQLKAHCSHKFAREDLTMVNSQLECIICLDPFVEGVDILSYPECHHKYHTTCLLHWLTSKTTCPMCRRGIRSSLYKEVDQGRLLGPPEH